MRNNVKPLSKCCHQRAVMSKTRTVVYTVCMCVVGAHIAIVPKHHQLY